MVSSLIRSNTFKWDFIPLPEGPAARAGLVFNDAWSVWAQTKYPAEAVEFLTYLTGAENEKDMMLSVHGWLPARRSLFTAWDTESQGAQEGYNVAAYTKGLDVSRQDPYWLENAKVMEIWTPIWEQIWVTGDLGLEEGLVLLTSEVNAYLATVA
jgi:ABC-type glycerol-3-phosphate transport system substrate-binding protein